MKYKTYNNVKVKTWDELEKEFGVNTNGNIATPLAFTKEMEEILADTDRCLRVEEAYKIGYVCSINDTIICSKEDNTPYIFEDVVIEGKV